MAFMPTGRCIDMTIFPELRVASSAAGLCLLHSTIIIWNSLFRMLITSLPFFHPLKKISFPYSGFPIQTARHISHSLLFSDGEVLASQQDGAVQFTSFSTCVGQFASGRKCVAGKAMLCILAAHFCFVTEAIVFNPLQKFLNRFSPHSFHLSRRNHEISRHFHFVRKMFILL